MKVLLTLLVLSLGGFSQDTRMAFTGHSAAFNMAARLEREPAPKAGDHRFWDRQNKISFAVTAAIRSFDIAQTCYGLAHGARELTLPTQSCAGVAGFVAAGQGGQLLGQWIAHRHGWHRLERVIPYVSAT